MLALHRTQCGFSTLGLVIVFAGVAGVIGGFNVMRSKSSLSSSDVRNAGQEAGDANFNALNVYQALVTGAEPAIFPDPYLPVNKAELVVSSKAVPNKLWDWKQKVVTVHSKSFHGKPQGTPSATHLESLNLQATDAAHPYLITKAGVKASTAVGMVMNKTQKSIDSKANLTVGPPPVPACAISVTGSTTMQPFTCQSQPASTQPVIDPVTKLQQVDALGNPVVITIPAVFTGCAGASLPWTLETDFGQPVTLNFLAHGVVVDAKIQAQSGSTGALDFSGGPIPKVSAAVPYPGAHRVESINTQLRQVNFVAANSSWFEMEVAGPDGKSAKCFAGIHVNKGPTLNLASDSWGADTRVQVAAGDHRRISELQVGDRLWNPKLHKFDRILYIHESMPSSSMMKLRVGQEFIHVTSLHPFVTSRGVLRAKDLKPGDHLPGVNQSWLEVSAAEEYRPERDGKVYDIFLDSVDAPHDRSLAIQGLLVPSFEGQRLLDDSLRGESGTVVLAFDIQVPFEIERQKE